MKKIVLCSNPQKDANYQLTKAVYEKLDQLTLQPVVCPVYDERDGIGGLLRGVRVAALEQEVACADMIITLGGDGTILRAARAAAPYEVPILGINLGNKGFIAELEQDELALLFQAVSGDYHIVNRMMLDVSVERNGQTIYQNYALNDIVINCFAAMMGISVFGDHRKMTAFSGDGVVVATPTGSTAYSMSAGGPIVEPSAENLIITPLCPHALIAKSFVLAPDREVTVTVHFPAQRTVHLLVDGTQPLQLQDEDRVTILKSKYYTKLVHLSGKSFYEKVNEKLGER